MKKTLLLTSLVISSSTVFAALPLYEPFADATGNGGTSYTVGANVTAQNNGSGDVTWSAVGPAGANNTVAAANLTVPGLSLSSGGSMEYGVSSGPSARLNLGSSFTSGTLYYSFALKVADLGSLGTSGGFAVAFNNAQGAQVGTPSVVTACLMMRSVVSAASGNFNIGIRKATGTPTWDSTVFSITDPNPIFVVASLQFNTGNSTDDVASMWLNPSSSTFGNPSAPFTALTHTGVNDTGPIASLVFFRRATAANQAADMFSDEIRVGTTWADVTPPIPEPASMALATIGGFALLGLRAFRSRK